MNAAGCGSTMKTYGELLADDPEWAGAGSAFASQVRDVTETLAGLPPQAARQPIQRCASRTTTPVTSRMRKASAAEPRALLQTIPGLTLVPLAEPDICCGSAGIFNLVQPEMAAALGQRKAAHIADAGVGHGRHVEPGLHPADSRSRCATPANPPQVIHVVELLDRVDTVRSLTAGRPCTAASALCVLCPPLPSCTMEALP